MVTENSPPTQFRRAVYGGLVASVWATVGWLAWLFVRAVLEDWTAIFGPVVGALLALIVRAAEHYHEVAEYEKFGGTWTPEEAEEEATPRRFSEGLGRSVALLALAFVALTCEHVLGELMRDYFVPFVASVATLFPAGALLTVTFDQKLEETGSFTLFLRGLVASLVAGSITAAVQAVMGGAVDYAGIFGWWVVVGMGLSFACGAGPLRAGRALFGSALALGVIALFSLPWPYRLAKAIPIVQISAPVEFVGLAVGGAIDAPDVPSQFWKSAEEREAQRKADEAQKRDEPTNGVPDAQPSPFGRWLANLVGYVPPPPTPRLKQVFDVPLPSDGNPIFKPPVLPPIMPKPVEIPDYNAPAVIDRLAEELAERRQHLGADLIKGWESSFVRSWLVMTLFVLGLGLAPWVEEELRPRDYPTSRTALNDRILFACLVGFVALTILAFRTVPSLTR